MQKVGKTGCILMNSKKLLKIALKKTWGNFLLLIYANCPNLLFPKLRGGNSKCGINWQNLAKIRFFWAINFKTDRENTNNLS